MLAKLACLATLSLALNACGMLDPAAQQDLLLGPRPVQIAPADPARAVKLEAGMALIMRGVNEQDPERADRYIAIGERLLQ